MSPELRLERRRLIEAAARRYYLAQRTAAQTAALARIDRARRPTRDEIDELSDVLAPSARLADVLGVWS